MNMLIICCFIAPLQHYGPFWLNVYGSMGDGKGDDRCVLQLASAFLYRFVQMFVVQWEMLWQLLVVYDIWKMRNVILHQGQIPSDRFAACILSCLSVALCGSSCVFSSYLPCCWCVAGLSPAVSVFCAVGYALFLV